MNTPEQNKERRNTESLENSSNLESTYWRNAEPSNVETSPVIESVKSHDPRRKELGLVPNRRPNNQPSSSRSKSGTAVDLKPFGDSINRDNLVFNVKCMLFNVRDITKSVIELSQNLEDPLRSQIQNLLSDFRTHINQMCSTVLKPENLEDSNNVDEKKGQTVLKSRKERRRAFEVDGTTAHLVQTLYREQQKNEQPEALVESIAVIAPPDLVEPKRRSTKDDKLDLSKKKTKRRKNKKTRSSQETDSSSDEILSPKSQDQLLKDAVLDGEGTSRPNSTSLDSDIEDDYLDKFLKEAEQLVGKKSAVKPLTNLNVPKQNGEDSVTDENVIVTTVVQKIKKR